MLDLLRKRRFAPLFVTQLLGALNDNLFKSALVVVLTIGAAHGSGLSLGTLVNLSTALLIAPFFLFSALAGELADKPSRSSLRSLARADSTRARFAPRSSLDKARLVRWLKGMEVAVMIAAAIGFHLRSLPILFTALFFCGVHSAFFGPLKYGILPQHLEAKELLPGNALVELGTFVAILLGTLIGGIVVGLDAIGVTAISALVIGVAILGWLVSRAIPAAPGNAELAIDWNLPRGIVKTLALAKKNRPAFRAIVGASWFWFLGALLLAQLPLVAAQAIGGDEGTITILLAIFTFGIGAGSLMCGKLSSSEEQSERACYQHAPASGATSGKQSRGRIELGLVAPAALATAGMIFDLAMRTSAAVPDGRVPLGIALDLFGLGLAGGVYVVPLYALMQERSSPEERSRIVGANNVMNAVFMVASAGFAIGLGALGASLSTLLVVTAALALVAAIVAAVLTRDFLLRLLIGAVVRVIYRVRDEGLEHVPEHGAAIVVANHVTYADAIILGGLCRRPVRFVMYHRIHDAPMLRWFFRLVRAIPIAPKNEDPERLARALEEIDRALAEGEVVGLFPEGKLTRDGELDDFRPGVERILARRPVPVVPIALRGLWGSFFSWAGGPPFKKWPKRFWSRVEIVCGAAIAPSIATAGLLRARVFELIERGTK